MNKYDFSIINLLTSGMIVGWAYYEPDPVGEFNYYELDIYLLIIQLQFRWSNEE